ncbi:phage portal protein [Bradyrhizobium sp. Gha]|uniref:phage portal protein n=1 Tax=Bradyrhizobium sp. Gha TaxID=1855318 RepID=UPI0008DFA900|nr:phage portal protein [Bradyrhizobium sp. Gha]SFJ25656.1 phage portal protein, HK97 family [Bradyrhizobium sp. Gha]
MNLLTRIFGSRTERRNAVPTSWDLMRGLTETQSRAIVSPYYAENLSAVYACIQCISETVACLPLHVYRRAGDGVKLADNQHPVARLFQQPNTIQTASEFFEMLLGHCLLRGNAYAEIERDRRGAPIGLIPYHPDQVSVWRIPKTRQVVYDISDLDGRRRRLLSEEVLHLRDRSDDGIIGKSRLQRTREALGTTIATEWHAASTFKNGVRLSGVLSHPDRISTGAHNHIRDSFTDEYAGPGKAGKVAVLEEGLKWQSISVSPEDAELLASRRFGTETIARIYRVPLPLLADISNGSYANVVELNRMFATHCLTPWIVRLEQVIMRDLLSEEGQRTHLVEIDQDDLLRGDMLTRWQSYRIMREIGGASANEIRAWEKINRRSDPAGDEFLSPMNMQSEQSGAPKQAAE